MISQTWKTHSQMLWKIWKEWKKNTDSASLSQPQGYFSSFSSFFSHFCLNFKTRPSYLTEKTTNMIYKFFPGIFHSIIVCNSYWEGDKFTKYEVCRKMGCSALIDGILLFFYFHKKTLFLTFCQKIQLNTSNLLQKGSCCFFFSLPFCLESLLLIVLQWLERIFVWRLSLEQIR